MLDTIIRNGSVLVEQESDPRTCDLGLKDGLIVQIEDRISDSAVSEIDAEGCLVVPGAVDPHFHLGIYRAVGDDASTETRAAAAGGVTSILSYFRTGGHYLNRSGSYREIFPAVLGEVEGKAHVDYAFHLVPMTNTHLTEIEWLVRDMGVTSFKFFWSYVGAGVDPESEAYDGAYAFELMERIAAVNTALPDAARVSLSVHCEDADILNVFAKRTEQFDGVPLSRYSQSRPTIAETLSIHRTAHMAAFTGAPINFLHLSSSDAVKALVDVRRAYPDHDFRGETGAHYLTIPERLGDENFAKVNPPIRGTDSAEAIWAAVTDGQIDWFGSDHCCSLAEHKAGEVWDAVPGFGGTSYIYPFLLTEGYLAGRLSLGQVVRLASARAAQSFGIFGKKGRIGIGADADIAIFEQTPSRYTASHSAQDFQPYGGAIDTGVALRRTLLRGQTVAIDGEPVDDPRGEYLHRPLNA